MERREGDGVLESEAYVSMHKRGMEDENTFVHIVGSFDLLLSVAMHTGKGERLKRRKSRNRNFKQCYLLLQTSSEGSYFFSFPFLLLEICFALYPPSFLRYLSINLSSLFSLFTSASSLPSPFSLLSPL